MELIEINDDSLSRDYNNDTNEIAYTCGIGAIVNVFLKRAASPNIVNA